MTPAKSDPIIHLHPYSSYQAMHESGGGARSTLLLPSYFGMYPWMCTYGGVFSGCPLMSSCNRVAPKRMERARDRFKEPIGSKSNSPVLTESKIVVSEYLIRWQKSRCLPRAKRVGWRKSQSSYDPIHLAMPFGTSHWSHHKRISSSGS
jgi:hypothetical protein